MDTERSQSEPHTPERVKRLYDARATVVVAAVLAAAILVAVLALVTLGDHSFRYYASDPASVLVAPTPLVGLMSHAGVLFLWGAAVVAVFAGGLVARARGWRAAAPLLAFAAAVSYAALDDLFMFHENIYPSWLPIAESTVLVAYGLGFTAMLWWFRHVFRAHDGWLLVLALGVIAVSYGLDLFAEDVLVKRWIEDVTKLFGFTLLAAYVVRLSARMVVEAYPVTAPATETVEFADSPARVAGQSSEPPANAVATPSPT